jgi:prophage antirepressor-like protein
MTTLTPDPPFTPEVFTRHHQQLHAILIDAQAWFSARDIGHLMGLHLNEALLRKLDPDQQQTLTAIPRSRCTDVDAQRVRGVRDVDLSLLP